jgi:hypothetical protein
LPGQTTRWISSIFPLILKRNTPFGVDNGRFLSGTRLFRDGPVTSGSLSVRQIGSWKPNGFNYEWAFKSADAVFYITNWFCSFQFNPVPLNFNPNNKVSVYNSSYKAEYQVLEQKLDALSEDKKVINLLYRPTQSRLWQSYSTKRINCPRQKKRERQCQGNYSKSR